MKEIDLQGNTGRCKILLDVSLDDLSKLIQVEKAIIITDTNIYRLYGEKVSSYRVVLVNPGEKNKNLVTVREIYEKLLGFECDRSNVIIGIGGGVVCDIAGFVASTYLRGLPFVFVPTTLLAQVDAAIGGKNGVNFLGYKNLIGTINQPGFVLYDFTLLNSLSKEELKNGFAEAIKHGLIGNISLFSFMEEHYPSILCLESHAIERVIYDSLKLKTAIVSLDEKETGERRILNFGHTIGHALEKSLAISHGEAVSLGMVVEARLSELRGYIDSTDMERILRILDVYGLPVSFNGDRDLIIDAILKDKKREGNSIYAVLLKGMGKASIEKIMINEIIGLLDDMCKYK